MHFSRAKRGALKHCQWWMWGFSHQKALAANKGHRTQQLPELDWHAHPPAAQLWKATTLLCQAPHRSHKDVHEKLDTSTYQTQNQTCVLKCIFRKALCAPACIYSSLLWGPQNQPLLVFVGDVDLMSKRSAVISWKNLCLFVCVHVKDRS